LTGAAAPDGADDDGDTKRRLAQIRTELEQDLARPAQPDVHMSVLQAILELPATKTTARRGAAGQRPRRELEHVVRLRAVQFAERLLEHGYCHSEVAERLGLNVRTLRSWHPSGGGDGLVLPLGRPPMPADAAQRQAVFSCLDTLGPGVGVPRLRSQFTDLARAELDDLLKGYRCCWRAAHPRLVHVLHWQRPGTVWAMDFAQAPCLIDGRDRYLLAVRDLASGQQLLWQPVPSLTAAVVLAELPLLFALHGAPLVLKTDNGSAFRADELRWLLQRCGVGHLFSPPWTPGYNGAIEASIGSLKKRTEEESVRAGHAGLWTGADVESARVVANTAARPRRLHGRTPAEVWEARRARTPVERAQFQATVDRFRTEAMSEQGLTPEALPWNKQAAIDRVGFRRALVAHDLLLFQRRRIPPRIPRPKSATKG
jgi:transposase InsO family protein